MKTTALFALIVALLARQPAPRGQGGEEQNPARPPVQQSSVAMDPKLDGDGARTGRGKPPVKGGEPARKD